MDTPGLYNLAVSCVHKDVSRKPTVLGIANIQTSELEKVRVSVMSVVWPPAAAAAAA